MKKLFPVIIMMATLCYSCSPRITTYTHKINAKTTPVKDIKVYDLSTQEPDKYEVLGAVKIKGRGWLNCEYKSVVNKAKLEAQKIGGNSIVITNHFKPDEYNTCHRINAKITDTNSNGIKDMKLTDIPDSANYSVIHLYRPPGRGAIVTYQVNLGDNALWRIRHNSYNSVNVENINDSILWAQTEVKVETPIKIEKGKEYFVKCGVSTGIFFGRPHMEVVNNNIGYFEYKKIKKGNIKRMDTIITTDGKEIRCFIKEIEKDRVRILVYRDGKKSKEDINRSDIKEIKIK
jgi:hypothetical protein